MPPRTDELLAGVKVWCARKRGRQTELANILGVQRSAVTNWFAGRKTPTLEQGLAIQEFLESEKTKAKLQAAGSKRKLSKRPRTPKP
jgi:predicted transcriptional regulator